MTKSIKEITALLEILPNSDDVAKAACEQREPQLTKPAGSLGRLEEITQWLSAWQGKHPPTLDHVRARIFAGNHGVTAQGVSAFPAEVTHQMVLNFLQGGAAINQLCKTNAIELEVIALDLEKPTQDFTKSAAMTESDFVQAFEAGFQSVPAETDLLILGEMGIGNTSAAAAVAHALFGGNAADWVGSGTGVLSDGMARKVAAVEAGVQRHSGAKSLDILRCLGGRELVAMAGAVVAARIARTPVLLDGYVCCAAVAPLEAFVQGALDHCMVAHVSAEPGHRRLLERLDKKPLLDLNMRLGEGSGAALAVGLVRSALACHLGMATFAQAGVSGKD
jgi:nicotinate-nucleotide--dimethylbenzimidazole phosphoribosyltransferase